MKLSDLRRAFAFFSIMLLLTTVLSADESNESDSMVTEEEGESEEKRSLLMFGAEDKPKQFIPMPIFIQNPNLGTGFGFMPTVMFKTDYENEDSVYSVAAIPFFYTNTNSYFVSAFTSLHFMGDQLRIVTGGGYGRVNSDYEYGGGVLEQEVSFSFGALRTMYAVIPDLYLGGAYILSYLNYLKFDFNSIPLPIENVFTSGLYLTAQWDSRNSVYNATSGFLGTLEPGFFPTWLGSDSTYISLNYSFNGYQRIADPLFLAYRAAGSHAFLDTPYSALPTLGMGPDLRGYQAGQYRGDNLITAQAELRWNFVWRLYLTAFGGLGTFYGSQTDYPDIPDWDGVLFPSAGFGISFLTSEETGMIIRFDFAWAREGEFEWYFEMGNSF